MVKKNGKSRKSSSRKRTFDSDFKSGMGEIRRASGSFEKFNDRAQSESLSRIRTGGLRRGANADNISFQELLGY